jgi:hypothetical protein
MHCHSPTTTFTEYQLYKDMEVITDVSKVARCGLYCAACKRHTSGKCPGCAENHKATWCKVRACCSSNGIASCADCKDVGHTTCKLFNSFVAKMFGFVFNSDRGRCIERIKEVGYLKYAAEMAENKKQTLPRK